MLKVGYLGPIGTFTHKIAQAEFPKAELIPVSQIMPAIYGLDKGKFDFAVVPAENFHEGQVRETLRYLYKSKNAFAFGERYMQIVHCLGALPERGVIQRILSKDQALAQCSDWLYEHYPDAEVQAVNSTSYAAETIAKKKLTDAAAIASKEALELNGLEVLAQDLLPGNRTRFFLVGTTDNKPAPTGDDKTFLTLHPRVDRAGVLHGMLGFFAQENINLQSFYSRPNNTGGYVFYVEADAHVDDSHLRRAIDGIESTFGESGRKDVVKVIGCCADSHWKEIKT